MGMAVGGGKGAVANINMTPMIDVLLVLIIIFMVITPLTPKGLEALVPQPAPPNQQQNDADLRTVVVTVNKDSRAERVIFVKGDPDLEFQDIAKVIDAAKGVGIDKVGLMTPQMEAGN
jgi:biopolymer transport protein TolR